MKTKELKHLIKTEELSGEDEIFIKIDIQSKTNQFEWQTIIVPIYRLYTRNKGNAYLECNVFAEDYNNEFFSKEITKDN